MTWRRQVEESVEKVGLNIEEAADRTKCESDCGRNEMYPAIFHDEERTELKLDMMMMKAYTIIISACITLEEGSAYSLNH